MQLYGAREKIEMLVQELHTGAQKKFEKK